MRNLQKKLKLAKIHFLAIAIIVAGTLVASYFIYQNKQSTENAIPAGWAEYKDETYGIKFNYRVDWGTPKIIETSGDKGKSYTIMLAEPKHKNPDVEKSKSLSIRVESKDYTKKVCAVDDATSCGTIKALSVSDLKSRLEDKAGLTAYDETSYSTIAAQATPNDTKMLALKITKIINLKKMNADTLQLTYTLFGTPASCEETMETDSSEKCLNKNDYSDLQNMLASIKNI